MGKEITEIADGHFLLKDKLVDWDGNGRLVRLEIALDVTKSTRERRRSFRRRWIVSRRYWNAFV